MLVFLVKVRHGYTLRIGDQEYTENTFLLVTEEIYKSKRHILEQITARNDAERALYAQMTKELKEGKVKVTIQEITVQLRGGYSYLNPKTGRVLSNQEILTMPEDVYLTRHWIFNKIEKEKDVSVEQEPKPVDEESTDKDKEQTEEKKEDESDNDAGRKDADELPGQSNRALLRRPARGVVKQ